MGQVIGYAKSNHYWLIVSWTETVNSSANTSTCNFTVTFGGNWALNIGARYSGNSLTINGTTHSFTTGALSWGSTGGSATIYTLNGVSIPHNADGTASLTVSAAFACGIQRFSDGSAALPSISCSGTQALTTIARASAITSVTTPVNIGSATAVKWTPAASDYTFSLYFWVGSLSWTVSSIKPASTSAYTYNWTVPTSLYSSMPDITSLVLGVRLTTYNASGTELGSSSTTFTANIADSVKPSVSAVSISAVNSNSVIAGWGLYVKGYTQPKISATASAGSGSSISKYSVSGVASGSYTSMPQTLSAISQSGTLTYTVTVTDKRNRTASKSVSITAYDYSAPIITSFVVSRISDDSTHAQMRAAWSCSSVNGKNNSTGTLSWKLSTASSFTSYGTVTNGSTVNLDTSKVALSDASQYVFRLSVTDTVGNTVTMDYTVDTASVLMTWNSTGDGLTFGKISEALGVNAADYRSTSGGRIEHHTTYSLTVGDYWAHIGQFEMHQIGQIAELDLCFCNGQNGWASQNHRLNIMIMKAWQSSASTTASFGISYTGTGSRIGEIKIKGYCPEATKLDLWIYRPFQYSQNISMLIHGDYNSFTPLWESSTSEPSGVGVEQESLAAPILCSDLYISTSGGTYKPLFTNGSSAYVGVGPYYLEATSTEVKPSQSYKLSLGAEDRPWGRTYCDGLELYNKSDRTPFIDFHLNNATADYTGRIMQPDASHIGFYQPGGYINLYAIGVTNPSSRHVKHDIEDMGDVTGLLMKLRPVSFYYNSDAEDKHLQYGLIAEEAEQILPSIVDIPEGYKDEDRDYDHTEPVPGIDYSKLVPFLLKALQEQEKRLEKLEAQIWKEE